MKTGIDLVCCIKSYLLVLLATGIVACGGGSSSSSPVGRTYEISDAGVVTEITVYSNSFSGKQVNGDGYTYSGTVTKKHLV